MAQEFEYSGKSKIQNICAGDFTYIPDFISDPEDAFKQVVEQVEFLPRDALSFKIYGKVLTLPRDKQFYGDHRDDGKVPWYRYGGDYIPKVHKWTPILEEIRDNIETFTGQHCNHLVVNRYQNGNDHITFHRDKTKDFAMDASVMTVSLGCPRDFILKERATGSKVKISLQPGSVCILGPETNEKWYHSIPKRTGVSKTRISLTYRKIKTWRESIEVKEQAEDDN
eukprot:CAMPEP_0168554568 /NCGR_PEP_ID=MMETSP0413-20121227/7852_1 /TAXON_ID=136452 /ORGANISM="Filamoeba nolandi, Strain NC-AS-23-1" /LENGTH=224 /DNA_ID=CAMNT_0008585323 /DNA_START=139 /DNA_END=813 /DNA_ORIENTATION=+